MKRIKKIGLLLVAGALPITVMAAKQTDSGFLNAASERFWTGTVTRVHPLQNTITARSIWLTKTFNVGAQCHIRALDKENASLGYLVAGDRVRIAYTTVHGVPVADTITQAGSQYTGTVKSVDRTGHVLTIAKAPVYLPAAPNTFRVAEDCKITLAGVLEPGHAATLYDVQPGDRITVIYDFPHGRPVVYRIKEKTSSFTGTVDAIDLTHRTVSARNKGIEKKFIVAADCKVVLDGSKKERLRNVQPGFVYRFTYEDAMGINVLERVTQPHPLAGVGPFNGRLSVVNNPR